MPARDKHVLAPFWSDIDLVKGGNIRYVLIEAGNTAAMAVQIMTEATQYANDNNLVPRGVNFQPTWALVAQWDSVQSAAPSTGLTRVYYSLRYSVEFYRIDCE